jgi:predicted ester cyclase
MLYDECLAEEFRALFFGHGWIDRGTYIEEDQRFVNGFTDTRVAVHDVVAEGDTVMCRMTWSGLHTGPADGLPATGRRFEIMGFALDGHRDGRVVEHIPLFDRYALHEQLGRGGT